MNIDDVRNKYNSNEELHFRFFWKGPLSQWRKSAFREHGVLFHTAEHWMMWNKAMLFEDEKKAKQIAKALNPGEAKALGRKVANFDQVIWDQHKEDIVYRGNMHKFSNHLDLKEALLEFPGSILVEASPEDNIWGIGMASEDRGINNPFNWKGQNLLGFTLMRVRDDILKIEASAQLDFGF